MNEHIKNIFEGDELDEGNSVTTKFGNLEFNRVQPPNSNWKFVDTKVSYARHVRLAFMS